MQKWFERFGELFPLFSSFSICFFALQSSFLLQYNTSKFGEGLVLSFINILAGISLLSLVSTSFLYLSPISWHRGIKIVFFVLLYLGLLGSAMCDQYFLIAHERLDEAFFLFDWNEIWMIADPGNRLSWSLVFGSVTLIILPFILYKTIKRVSLTPFWMLLVALLFISMSLISTGSELNSINENRFVYFLKQSFKTLFFFSKPSVATNKDYKNLSPKFYGGHLPLDPRYPLTHRMDSPSLLKDYLNKTSDRKPPHIKIIIVESMSSDLFGQRGKNTGVIMPFLDSISRHSLYFPNAFSTYQRTHNVLPAVLASIPNTINGNVFQQLPFPRHFSLFNLLRKNYHTQFYCGVRLEYLNMVGLMSHYKTDYQSKFWNKKFQLHKESVGSAWGYPDEDLFKQAQYDDSCRFHKIKKPLFRVFLTISSHDPFIYPNKSKWEQEVLKKSSNVKDKKLRYLVRSQAASFGAFSYVDSTLQSFFQAESRQPEYKNTVYIITGDHGTELYRRNALSKYNIPIIIFSPLLKKTATSQAIVSHNDIAPTVLNYLITAYHLNAPDTVHFVGKELKMMSSFKPDRHLMFTTNKLKTTDLVANKLVYMNGQSQVLDSMFDLHPLKNDKRTKWIKQQLKEYQSFTNYTLLQNKVIDSISYVKWTGDRTQFVIQKRHHFSKIDLNNQMTYLASHGCSANKSLKIEVLATMWCEDKNAINNAPTLVLQSKKSKYLSFKWTLNKQIKCHFSGVFKRKSKNQIIYHLEFNPKEIVKLKKGQKVYLYLLNESKMKSNLNDLKLNFYTSK
jgi:phosphoglycerol transferase MdoB-like AlkP superfamily enzyme